MKLKSITTVPDAHTCSRCTDNNANHWKVTIWDGSCWYICDDCIVVVLGVKGRILTDNYNET